MNGTTKLILGAAIATTMFGATAYAGNPHGDHHHGGNDGLALAAGIVNLVRTVIDSVGTALFPTPGCEPIIRPAVRYNPPPPPPRHHAERRAPEPPPRKAAPRKAKERRKAEPAPRRRIAPQHQGRRR